MLELNCNFQLGFYGSKYNAGTLRLTTANVGGAAGLFSSHHILKMGRHFSEYVENPVDRFTIETQEIYTPSPLPLLRTIKKHAPDITGAIGESLGAIACRQILGLPSACIEPLKVFKKKKTPDFRIQWDASNLLNSLGRTLTIPLPEFWPLKSKMRKGGAHDKTVFNEALQQLATYWFYRAVYEPECLGFGLISYYENQSDELRIYVLVPSNIQTLRQIHDHYSSNGKEEGFTKRFKTGVGNFELDGLFDDVTE